MQEKVYMGCVKIPETRISGTNVEEENFACVNLYHMWNFGFRR